MLIVKSLINISYLQVLLLKFFWILTLQVAYVIPVGEKQYLVHLKKQSFISSGSVVSYYKKDVMHSKPLKTQMDCNYQGYVAGFPNSIVTLSICSGLRGLLQFENISYGIEPMEAVSGFVHMIYEGKNDNVPLLRDSDIYSWSRDSHYEVRKTSQGTEFFKISPLYLEMHIVVDKDLMLTQLKLTVVVSSIEIWSDKNKISTTGNPDHILFRLLEWEQKLLILRPHHTTFLFSFRNYTSLIGTTYPGKLCLLDYAKGVALYSKGLSLESFAVIIVQLLGLNVGLTYDSNIGSCHCSADVCTMTPKAVHFQGIKEFSICSLDEFKYITAQSGLKCLLNHPIDVPVYKQARVCGNGILDPGEQCDCGTTTTCTHKRCCDARTCIIKKDMDCGSGRCCTQNCKIKPADVVCRPSVDKECDFTEYCNGTSGSCVPDTFARNGQYCDSGDAFCYQGKCRSFDRQCQALIGGGKSFIQGRYASARTQLQLIAYICLPVLIITTAVLIKQTKLRKLYYREESDSEGSVTEENSSSSKVSLSARADGKELHNLAAEDKSEACLQCGRQEVFLIEELLCPKIFDPELLPAHFPSQPHNHDFCYKFFGAIEMGYQTQM
ncbi:PREDICTED: disintegrin and metalloproteinase domain-containing protein 5-like [Chrysochloris asiatica]|uniref:Disintegrin and metalloproteinase domain-containing protein 5-like n=1 Tax=Chrysochloris asiatica TaxID=185453 RepID=A0A9B0WMB6_CHRAS|nr:PREDICTED: disintegrin and metalloproteinase domain-containing protein 5-like [Chrysochloris asiatica]